MQYQKELAEMANKNQMRFKDFLRFLERPDEIKKGSAKRKWKKQRAR